MPRKHPLTPIFHPPTQRGHIAFGAQTGITVNFEIVTSISVINGPWDIVKDGNYCYVTVFDANRVYVIDVSTPTSPTIIAYVQDVTQLPSPRRLVKEGNYLYVTCFRRVTVVDVSTPLSPSVVGSVSDILLGGGSGIAKGGNYCFVGTGGGTNRFCVVDVSTPSVPTLSTAYQNTTHLPSPTGVIYSSPYCFVVNQTSPFGRFTVVDVSTPTSPSITTSLPHAALISSDSLVKSGNYCYVLALEYVAVVDISTPSTPSVVGSVNDASMFLDLGLGFGQGIAVEGNYAYTRSTSDDRFVVVDISNPTAPSVITSIQDHTILDGFNALVIDGNYAYGVSYEAGLFVVIDVRPYT